MKVRKLNLVLALVTALCFSTTAKNNLLSIQSSISVHDYIDTYKTIAMSEMKRTGIPASIILSQAILESNYGNSSLAKKAHNHFGIKCTDFWDGHKVYANDETLNECFRKYESPYDSYIDHSNFLLTRSGYSKLFLLSPKDYEAWAAGLQEKGYSTNSEYASLIIDLVKRYELNAFDFGGNKCSYVEAAFIEPELLPEVFYHNGIKTVLFSCEVTPQQVAEHYAGISNNELLTFNDFSSIKVISAGTHIFLEPKKNKAAYGIQTHIVAPKETMREISQLYGVKLEKLYQRNKMEDGSQPAFGEMIYLRGRRNNPPLMRLGNQLPITSAKQEVAKPPVQTHQTDPFPVVSSKHYDKETMEISNEPLQPPQSVYYREEPEIARNSSSTKDDSEDEQQVINSNIDDTTLTRPITINSAPPPVDNTPLVENALPTNDTDDTTDKKEWIPTKKNRSSEITSVPDVDFNAATPSALVTSPGTKKIKPETEIIAEAATNLAETKLIVSPYTIKKGDNLYRISQKFKTTIKELKRINNMTSDVVITGKKIMVPQMP